MPNPFSETKAGKKAGARKASSSSSKARPPRDKGSDVDLNDDEIEAMLPTALSRAFVGTQIERMNESIEKLGLKPPSEYEGDMPDLPEEIADLTHDELSNLMAQFQNALSTATWQASVAHVQNNTFDEIADYLENRAILDSDQSTEQKRKADARTDDTVVFFRGMSQHASNQYVLYRDLAKTIDGKIKVVSRVGGFLGDEQEDSDVRADKASTRGTGKGAVKFAHLGKKRG